MKVKALLYCTKGNKTNHLHKLYKENKHPYYQVDNVKCWELEPMPLNGTIVAECEIETEEIKYKIGCPFPFLDFERELPKTCLTDEELEDYLGIKGGYALLITNLKVFEKQLELNEVEVGNNNANPYLDSPLKPLTKAPQNMCSCYYKNKKYVLISIQPHWLCKILNGEKTLEIRKKVLKCMKG